MLEKQNAPFTGLALHRAVRGITEKISTKLFLVHNFGILEEKIFLFLLCKLNTFNEFHLAGIDVGGDIHQRFIEW